MRKVALFCATAVVGALGVSAVAGAVTGPQTVDVKTRNNRAGTSSKPRSVGRLTVTTGTPIVPGDAPWAATRAVISFDRNLVFNSRNFRTCSVTQIRRDNTRCPAGSRVGGGTASASVFSGPAPLITGQQPTANVTPTVTAYNGPRSPSGAPRILLLVVERQFNVRDVMTGTLKPASGKYGRKLDVVIPAKLQNAGLPGISIALTRFTTSVGGTRGGTPFVGLRGCTGGKLSYKGDFTFTDGSRLSDTSTANCRRR
jgi:hypothetical protein